MPDKSRVIATTLIVVSTVCLSKVLAQTQSQPATLEKTTKTSTTTTTNSTSSEPTNVLPATSRSQAKESAKEASGREDPLAPVEGFRHFPSSSHSSGSASHMVIPPPPNSRGDYSQSGETKRLSKSNPYLRIPPPPMPVSGEEENQLPVSELPAPPDRPSLVSKMKLTGIVGNKAIFAITDIDMRVRNKWPKSVMLGAGDKFESVSLISVSPTSAQVEENGERLVKQIDRIR